VNLRTEHLDSLKEMEEENMLVVEGLKAEFEERIQIHQEDDLSALKDQIMQMKLESEQSKVREEMLRQKIERKKEKVRELKSDVLSSDSQANEIIKQLRQELENKDEELSKYKSVCSRPESANSYMMQFTY